MRLPARPTATSLLCATFLLGVTGPAAVAADGAPARERTAAVRVPAPDADADAGTERTPAQAEALKGMGGLLEPVTKLLGTVLKTGDGRLTPEQTDRLTAAIEEALAKAQAQASGSPVTTDPADDEDDDWDDEDDDDWDDEDDDDWDDEDDEDDGDDWDDEDDDDWEWDWDWKDAPGTAPDVATLPAWSSPARDDDPAAAPAADVTATEMAELQSGIEALEKAGASGAVEQLGSAVSDLVESLGDAVSTILAGDRSSAAADPS